MRVLPALLGIFAVAAGLTAARAASAYSIDGLTLGEQVQLERNYQCEAAEHAAGFRWCQKLRQDKSKHGKFNSTISILQNQDGIAVYVNRLIEPAFFGSNDIPNEIARLSDRFGERAREKSLPPRDNLPTAVIAVWGKIQLEPLDSDALAKLASGETSRQNLLVDHLGDVSRSAQLGLPIYRISGSAGYLWSASAHANGRGHLRFLTIDPSAFVPKSKPKVASAHPATLRALAPAEPPRALTPEPEPLYTSSIAANMTVRAKSRPDQVLPARAESERASQWFSPAESTKIQAARFEPAKPASEASHRAQWITAIIGVIAIMLFLIAFLMEYRHREPTGLELLELERRRADATAPSDQNAEEVSTPEAAIQVKKMALTIGPLLSGLGAALCRVAAAYCGRLAQINDAARDVILRMSTPGTKA